MSPRLTQLLFSLMLVLMLMPASAFAQGGAFIQGFGAFSTGGTNEANPGDADSRADGFSEIAPGLRLAFKSGRAIHMAQYQFFATLYYRGGDATAYSNALRWVSRIRANESNRVQLLLTLLHGQQNAFSMQDAFTGGPQPAGDLTFINPLVAQTWESDLGRDLTFSESMSFELFTPIAGDNTQPQTFEWNLAGEISRRYRRHSFGGGANVTINTNYEFTDPAIRPEPFPKETLQVVSLLGNYAYQLARFWTASLQVGVLETSSSADSKRFYLQPLVTAALRMNRRDMNFEFTFQHNFQPSVQVGSSFRTEEFRLAFGLPLGKWHGQWRIRAAAGYDYATQIIVRENRSADDLHSYLADLEVRWRLSDVLTILTRYQLSGQTTLPAGVAPELPGFTRHIGLLGVLIEYPGTQGGTSVWANRRNARRIDATSWRRMFHLRQ